MSPGLWVQVCLSGMVSLFLPAAHKHAVFPPILKLAPQNFKHFPSSTILKAHHVLTTLQSSWNSTWVFIFYIVKQPACKNFQVLGRRTWKFLHAGCFTIIELVFDGNNLERISKFLQNKLLIHSTAGKTLTDQRAKEGRQPRRPAVRFLSSSRAAATHL